MSWTAFESEEILREALVGLFSRIPGILRIEHSHGSQELGKDIVFYYQSPLGDEVACACVVKNTKISGAAGATSGRAVLDQVEQALDSEFINDYAERANIHQVYLISPDDITQSARNAVAGRLKHRKGQVVFLGGARLFELFQKHWPDFLYEKQGLMRYLQFMKDSMNDSAGLHEFLLQRGYRGPADYPARIYIPLELSRSVRTWASQNPVGKLLDAISLLDSLVAVDFRALSTIADKLDSLIRSIEHLKYWQPDSIASPLIEDSPPSSVREALLVELRHAHAGFLNEAGKAKLEQEKSHEQSTGVRVGKLSDQGGIAVSSVIRDLAQMCRFNSREACLVLKQVESLCCWVQSNLELRENSVLVKVLDNSLVSLFCVEDFLATSPIGLVDPNDITVKFQLGSDILNNLGSSVLIVGPAGSGKTSFCKWRALADAKALAEGASDTLPIYFPLHLFSLDSEGDFRTSFIQTKFVSSLLPKADLDRRLESGRVRLYLDGLDEVAEGEAREAVMKSVREGLAKYSGVQVVVTCRDVIVGSWLSWLPRIYLSGLVPFQQDLLAREWLGNEDLVDRFKYQIERTSSGLREVMEIPLLATLTILVFRQTGKLPVGRSHLFQMFAELMSGGWDLAKRVTRRIRFGQHVKIIVLSRIALRAHMKRHRFFGKDDFSAVCEDVVILRSSTERDELIDELIVDGVIYAMEDGFIFRHLSFQEFFAAKEILADPNRREFANILREFMFGDDWWREVARFCIEFSENPQLIARQIRTWSSASPDYKERASRALGWVRDAYPEFELI